MRICFVIFAFLLSITLLTGISCTKPTATPPELPVTISVTPKSGKAGTKFDISCNNLKGTNEVRLKVLQSDGTLVIDRVVLSDNLSTSATSISTFGFDPGHYQCRLEGADGKLEAQEEFDVTGTKHIIFEDDFSNGYSGWYVASTENYTTSYGTVENQPVYQMRSKNTSVTTLYSYLQRLGQIGDCVIEVDCWSLPGDKVGRGIVFHAQENNEGTWNKVSFDAFGIGGETLYGMQRITNGKLVILLPDTYADVIKTKGLTVVNQRNGTHFEPNSLA